MEKEVSLVPNIRNMGFLKGEQLRKVIEEARFCVFPSEWFENCPFAVLEAQSCGTPALGAAIGGIPELIRDGETGTFFESGNLEQLCQKISELWNDREKLARYTENCRNTLFDTLERYCEKLIKLYKE